MSSNSHSTGSDSSQTSDSQRSSGSDAISPAEAATATQPAAAAEPSPIVFNSYILLWHAIYQNQQISHKCTVPFNPVQLRENNSMKFSMKNFLQS
jgi:hypothetical protein